MIWRLRDLPELAHFSDDDRASLLRIHAGRGIQARFISHSLVYGLFFASLLFLLIALMVGLLTPQQQRGVLQNLLAVANILPPIALIAGGLIGWLICGGVVYQISMIRVRGQLRIALLEYLKSGGELPVCLRCGYSFEPPAPSNCPECGAPAG